MKELTTQKKYNIPRFMLAAPKSGSGKTFITCGLMYALKKRGMKLQGFKCGPDYIDPMYLRKTLDIEIGNLDTFFTDKETTIEILCDAAKDSDIAVIEGVMGYYDGLGGVSLTGSSYDLAAKTKTPVVLIVDGSGASVSLAALIKGIIEFRDESNIKAVILNKISSAYYERIAGVIEEECKVAVLGYVPKEDSLYVPSRHLGLVSPEEIKSFNEWIQRVAMLLEEHIDIDKLIELANEAEDLAANSSDSGWCEFTSRVKIAIARDEAFSFYYAENISLLKKLGGEIIYFSPLDDERLPDDVDGAIFGGGYPELFAKRLSENESMRRSIKAAYDKGMPIVAECGGFMYIGKSLEDADGNEYPMVGILEGRSYKNTGRRRFGYIELTAKTGGLALSKEETVRAHEFHHWDCTENGDSMYAVKPLIKQEGYTCVHQNEKLFAGYPHVYYPANKKLAENIVSGMEGYSFKRLSKKKWDEIAKPIDSLGKFETMVSKLCGIQRSTKPYPLTKKALLIFCADHGVVAEGVTQTGKEVTQIVSENFAKGLSTVNYMSGCAGVDVYTIDIGMSGPKYNNKELAVGKVIDRRIADGTNNLARKAAMTVEQCEQAINVGIELVGQLKEMGYTIIATGEMGIGNTTPTSALAAILLDMEPKLVTGKGAGLSNEGISKKCEVVALAKERVINNIEDYKHEIVHVLAEAGGYEIAGMAGAFLGGLRYKVPIVIDGAISAVSALAAYLIDNRVANIAFASHESHEITERLALSVMGLEAVIKADMCLGEGTGAVALMPLLEMANTVYEKMGTFGSYNIDKYERFEN